MRPIPANILQLAQRHAPALVAAVRAAAAEAAQATEQQQPPQSQKPGEEQASRATVRTTLSHFSEGDMSLVYACLWYAHTERVAVLFEPPFPRQQHQESAGQTSPDETGNETGGN